MSAATNREQGARSTWGQLPVPGERRGVSPPVRACTGRLTPRRSPLGFSLPVSARIATILRRGGRRGGLGGGFRLGLLGSRQHRHDAAGPFLHAPLQLDALAALLGCFRARSQAHISFLPQASKTLAGY